VNLVIREDGGDDGNDINGGGRRAVLRDGKESRESFANGLRTGEGKQQRVHWIPKRPFQAFYVVSNALESSKVSRESVLRHPLIVWCERCLGGVELESVYLPS
jgi:hypothetical protein